MRQGFVAGEEGGTAKHAAGAEHQRCGQTASVGDAACRDNRDLARNVDDGRHERQCRALAAMSAGLCSLGNDDVRAAVDGVFCVFKCLHLDDEARIRPCDAQRELVEIPER